MFQVYLFFESVNLMSVTVVTESVGELFGRLASLDSCANPVLR